MVYREGNKPQTPSNNEIDIVIIVIIIIITTTPTPSKNPKKEPPYPLVPASPCVPRWAGPSPLWATSTVSFLPWAKEPRFFGAAAGSPDPCSPGSRNVQSDNPLVN